MKQPEILAPAGSVEALTAAVRCGADAVYLGGQTLNARRAAEGFDGDALCRAAALCHTYGAKLYVTLNTITFDSEMPQVHELLRQCVRAGTDALIVQDFGTARLARACCDIPLHASTQTSVQTAAGVNALSAFGFVRAVLPRELTRSEVRDIRRGTDMQLEMFVHGALCMCVSGQCLMSAAFGSRSGNRGLCAQPCRLPFASPGGTGHDLSLKDLSLLPHLPQLRDMGIDSFKIEGRLKRPEYVAAAVTACKAALQGAPDDEIAQMLRAVFSRSGFTDGYYTAQRGVSMFGTRQKEDVTAASAVLGRLQTLYASPKPVHPVSLRFICRSEEPACLTAASGAHRVTVRGETPTAARNRGLDADVVRRQLTKSGGTVFDVREIDVQTDEGLFLPASALNALRRDALDALRAQIAARPARIYENREPPVPPHEAAALKTYVRFADARQIPHELKADRCFLPLYCGAETIVQHGAVAEIPRACFGREEAIRRALLECKACGVREAAFASADGLALARDCGLEPIAFFGSNIANSHALEEMRLRGVTQALLSCELPLAAAQKIGGTLPRGVWVYGCLPLMLTRNCPQKNGKACASCAQTGTVTDRKGVTFPIECRSGCAELLNAQPTYLLDKKDELRAFDFALLYFTRETPETCRRILDAWARGDKPSGAFTRGLAYRGVL